MKYYYEITVNYYKHPVFTVQKYTKNEAERVFKLLNDSIGCLEAYTAVCQECSINKDTIKFAKAVDDPSLPWN